jgi:hypothetical protein
LAVDRAFFGGLLENNYSAFYDGGEAEEIAKSDKGHFLAGHLPDLRRDAKDKQT